MNSFLYLYRRIFINRMKKSLKKPLTYICVIGCVLYVLMLVAILGSTIIEFELGTPQNLSIFLSCIIFFLLPANLIAYCKRKGLLFRKSDTHFMFPAPVNPKMVILFTGILNFGINLLMVTVVAFMGLLFFHVTPFNMLVYVVWYLVFENILEASMMILCYGNEKLPPKFFKVLTGISYALMAVFVVVAFWTFFEKGFSFAVASEYLSNPIIQGVPIVGWNIAVIRLIFVGPTVGNVICSILFCVSTIVLFVLAWRAKCEGEYYEDAAKFADTYAQKREKSKKGIVDLSVGKKRKFRQASVVYKGTGAKAIFYRQLLEYKKAPFFIFGLHTLWSLLLGIGIAVFVQFSNNDIGIENVFVIPGVMAYMVFLLGGFVPKWTQELENPYTYLIPDGNLKKLWYSTKMEHIKALIEGILITLPGAIVLKLSFFQIILTILIYICLMANKLYYYMLADLIIGKLLGSTAKIIVKLFLQGVAITFGVMGAVAGYYFWGIEAAFVILVIVTAILTFLGALAASLFYEKMEVLE